MKLKFSTLAVILVVCMIPVSFAHPGLRSNQTGLETLVRRDGLQFYLEITSSGLAEWARADGAMSVLAPVLSGSSKVGSKDLAAFLMTNSAALSNARIAIVGYTDSLAATLIEAATDSDAERLRESVTKLVTGATREDSTTSLSVGTRGRIVAAGPSTLVERLLNSSGDRTLADDQEFTKARSRFSNDSLFAFIELDQRSLGLAGASDSQGALAQTPAMLAALSGLPHAIVLGGSLHGDSVAVNAILLNGAKRDASGSLGVLGSLFTATTSSEPLDQPRAASFAGGSTDVFLDLRIDWDKLLDAFQSLFGMLGQSVSAAAPDTIGVQAAPVQNSDFLAMAEASLGFSFRRDLIPCLGNEVGLAFSNMSNLTQRGAVGASARMANPGAKRSAPQFTLMLAVRDEAKFEKMLVKLLSGPKGPAAPFAQSPYRGAVIKTGRSVSYTITNGFLLVGGSANEVRRALDAQALGASLSQTPEFTRAMTASRSAAMQAYFSARLSQELLDSLMKETAKAAGLTRMATRKPEQPLPIGLSLIPDEDGLLIEANLPTGLLTNALAAVLNAKPLPYGISTGPSGSGAAKPGARTTPRLTEDDLRRRRP